jgi:hypothetical protein
MNVTILVVLAVIALVCVGIWWFDRKNTRRDAALKAEVERAQRVAEEAKCITPAAAQLKPKRRPRK